MKLRMFFVAITATIVGMATTTMSAARLFAAERANIIVILADDLGYGDPGCYGGKIATPQMDKLASQGTRFTDAHTTSGVCSPTRYSLVTGRYNWRSRLQNGVLGGLSPRLIEPDRMTIASMLKQQGYATACFGKWHLGMDWAVQGDGKVAELSIESREQVKNVDYSKPISNGPNSVGFDYYFGISASLDMVPYTFIENDHVVALPTEDRDFPMMLDRTPNSRTRKGPTAPGFEAENVLPELTRKSIEYIHQHASDARQGKPFFMYIPLASPHTPILPTKDWQGKSNLNPYADFVMQTDWSVGQIMKALDDTQLADNTLVVLTSDNGCSPQAKFEELIEKGHNPSGPLRGHKADIFEGGTRVPFLVRWPGKVAAGTTSDQLICQVDLMATFADMVGAKLPENAGEDSISFYKLLTTNTGSGRDHLVYHSINGSFAIRNGHWKLALCPDSGGWSEPKPNNKKNSNLPPMQLYNLKDDLGEKNNVIDQHASRVDELMKQLEKLVNDGRSTPGAPQKNTVPVNFRNHIGKK